MHVVYIGSDNKWGDKAFFCFYVRGLCVFGCSDDSLKDGFSVSLCVLVGPIRFKPIIQLVGLDLESFVRAALWLWVVNNRAQLYDCVVKSKFHERNANSNSSNPECLFMCLLSIIINIFSLQYRQKLIKSHMLRILNTIPVHDFHFTSSFFLFVCLFVYLLFVHSFVFRSSFCLCRCFFFLFSLLGFLSSYGVCDVSYPWFSGICRLFFSLPVIVTSPSKYTLHFQFLFTSLVLFVFCVLQIHT